VLSISYGDDDVNRCRDGVEPTTPEMRLASAVAFRPSNVGPLAPVRTSQQIQAAVLFRRFDTKRGAVWSVGITYSSIGGTCISRARTDPVLDCYRLRVLIKSSNSIRWISDTLVASNEHMLTLTLIGEL
jgi:hypothetical protein